MKKAKRGAYGLGSVFEASGAFYWRHYTVVNGQRVQKTEQLCKKDDKFYATNAKAVKELVKQRIGEQAITEKAAETAAAKPPDPADMKVSDFYTNHFVPFLQTGVDLKQRSASTLRFYRAYWGSYLRAYFGDETLASFSIPKATKILNDLATKGHKQSTIQNCRATGSAIFKRALKDGVLVDKPNPWREANPDYSGGAPVTRPYGLQEIKDIIAALGHCEVDHTNLKHHAVAPHQHLDGQLMMSLVFWNGLRASEMNGLMWQDFDGDTLSIQRSVENGISGKTKTIEAQAKIPVAEDVQPLLLAYHAAEGRPDAGWLFHHKRNPEIPLNRNNFAKRVIRPCVEEAGLVWKSYRGGRSGAATELTECSGNLVAAQQLLRHKRITTTARYQKATEDQLELKTTMKRLAAKSNGRRND